MTSAVEYDWSTCLRKCRPYTTVCKLGYFLFLVISLKQWMQTCSVYILQKKKLEDKETFTAVFGATK